MHHTFFLQRLFQISWIPNTTKQQTKKRNAIVVSTAIRPNNQALEIIIKILKVEEGIS